MNEVAVARALIFGLFAVAVAVTAWVLDLEGRNTPRPSSPTQ